MDYILMLIIGIITGIAIGLYISEPKKPIGVLKTEVDPEDGPYFFLELNDNSMEELEKSKYVMLEVKINNSLR